MVLNDIISSVIKSYNLTRESTKYLGKAEEAVTCSTATLKELAMWNILDSGCSREKVRLLMNAMWVILYLKTWTEQAWSLIDWKNVICWPFLRSPIECYRSSLNPMDESIVINLLFMLSTFVILDRKILITRRIKIAEICLFCSFRLLRRLLRDVHIRPSFNRNLSLVMMDVELTHNSEKKNSRIFLSGLLVLYFM